MDAVMKKLMVGLATVALLAGCSSEPDLNDKAVLGASLMDNLNAEIMAAQSPS